MREICGPGVVLHCFDSTSWLGGTDEFICECLGTLSPAEVEMGIAGCDQHKAVHSRSPSDVKSLGASNAASCVSPGQNLQQDYFSC